LFNDITILQLVEFKSDEVCAPFCFTAKGKLSEKKVFPYFSLTGKAKRIVSKTKGDEGDEGDVKAERRIVFRFIRKIHFLT
jgi:hypothetical protein